MEGKENEAQRADAPWKTMRYAEVAEVLTNGHGGMKAVVEAQQGFTLRAAEVNRQIADFVDRRLKHDQEMLQALVECKSPQEAFGVWGRFVETASSEYAEGLSAIAALGLDPARRAGDHRKREAEEAERQISDGETDA